MHEEATAKAAQLNILFMETSAKAGHNVKSLFKKIAMSLPGVEKEGSAEAKNTSKYFALLLASAHSPVCVEIDVTHTPAAEVPEASQCNC